MPIVLAKDIAEHMPREKRLLGLDVGVKTIGLAIGDPQSKIVTPLKTIKRTKFMRDMDAISAVVNDYDIGGYIIGLPLHMDGSEGRRAQSVRDFAIEFAKYFNDPWIGLWDERLSTETVENFVDDSLDMNRRKAKDRGITDQLAAAYILEDALGCI